MSEIILKLLYLFRLTRVVPVRQPTKLSNHNLGIGILLQHSRQHTLLLMGDLDVIKDEIVGEDFVLFVAMAIELIK